MISRKSLYIILRRVVDGLSRISLVEAVGMGFAEAVGMGFAEGSAVRAIARCRR